MNKNIKKQLVILLLYAMFLMWGLLTYKDYGVSYDELVQRRHGLVNFKYVYELIHGSENFPEYLESIPYTLDEYDFMKYYGVGIKFPLLFIEYINGFSMTNQQIFYMNHLYTFLLFFISSIFVYRIVKLLDFDFGYSLLAVLIYMICPRILADSFYNIKDSVFLSLFVIMLYFGLSVLIDLNWKNGVGLAVSAAFCLNTRIVGGLPLSIIIVAYLLRGKKISRNKVKNFLIIGFVSFSVYIFIAPAAWSGIFDYLYNVIHVFSDFSDHNGTVILAGQTFMSGNLPWFYLLLCIVLTMPSMYIIFCTIGLMERGKRFILDRKIKDNFLVFILFTQFIAILAYDAINRPVKYNMWRHFHFLFIYIVIFTVLGIRCLINHYKKHQILIKGYIIVSIFLMISWIIRNHPYEYLYFNPLFHGYLADKTEQDYWQISYQDLLKKVQDNGSIDVYTEFEELLDPKVAFFGEDGWEDYHINREREGAEYKLCSGKVKESIIYAVDDIFRFESRDIATLLKRKNYSNCVLKYYFNDNGTVTGDNHGTEIQWTYAADETERCLTAYIPESYNIYELDFIPTINDRVTNVRAYVSDNGLEWYTLTKERYIYESKDIFAIVSGNPVPQYLMIRYDLRETDSLKRDPEFLIRIYGEKSAEIAYVVSDYNEEKLMFLYDGDLSTRWDSGEYLKSDMYVEFGLRKKEFATGISLELGNSLHDYPRKLVIQGKDDEGNWNDIEYTCEDNENYVFDKPTWYSTFRIINKADTETNFWSIHELHVWTKNTEVSWNHLDTCNSIVSIQSNYSLDDLGKMLDNNLYNIWSSGGTQNSSMYVEIKMNPNTVIKGFHLDSGIFYIESARSLKILGSYDGDRWEEIMYHYASVSDYVFNKECDYEYYKLCQTGYDDGYGWVIAELGIIR